MPNVKEQTANVYLFEPPTSENIDVSSAGQYGRVQYLFRPLPGKKSRSSLWETDTLAREIVDRLAELDYEPTRDYICICGHQAATSIMLATVVAEYGLVNTLLFDTRERNYVARQLGREFDDYNSLTGDNIDLL